MSKLKVLVVHGNNDNVSTLIEKVQKLNAKAGPFESIILLGDINQSSLESLNIDNLPVIYALSSSDSETSTKVHEKINILNGIGIYQSLNGLKIGYVSYNDERLSKCKDEVLTKFEKRDGSIDILITREWSAKISEHNNRIFGSIILDTVVEQLRPQYHISSADKNVFYEMDPFKWNDSDSVTRFINVAEFESGSKWAYAFNLTLSYNLLEEDLEQVSSKLGINPYYSSSKKRTLEETTDNTDKASEKSVTKVTKQRKVLPSDCHFCFTNANLEDHMVLSIGNSAYLTTAKGPLTIPKGEMKFSGHCLLIPIEHIAKLNVGQENFAESGLVKELEAYEKSIVSMNYIQFDMSTIVFEINSIRSIHYHKQIFPIAKYLIMKFQNSIDRQLHLNNEKFSRNAKLEFKQFEGLDNEEYLKIRNDPYSNYLQFTVYETSEAPPKIYLASFQPEDRLDLQFGRRTVAFLLNLPKRIKWDSPLCNQTKEQETKEAETFQKSYKSFDIMNK